MDEPFEVYLQRTYGIDRGTTPDSYATTSVATREAGRAPPRAPAARSRLPTAAELSRRRAAKRAVNDTTQLNHLSTMYHMNRRIYESYKKSGLLAGGEASRPASRPGTAAQPATAPSGGAAAPQRHHLTFQQQRAGGGGHGSAAWGHLSMPPRTAGLAALAAEADAVIAAARPATTPPAPPSFVRRHVQNSRAALKAAILDEIVEHRVYEGSRLNMLFKSYLKLNSGEAFYPTLAAVIEQLRAELGVE